MSFNTYVVYRRDILLNMLAMMKRQAAAVTTADGGADSAESGESEDLKRQDDRRARDRHLATREWDAAAWCGAARLACPQHVT